MKIRRLRKLRGWTQAQLADRAGLAQQHVAKLEGELADPQVSTLRKVADALDVEVPELFWTRAEFQAVVNQSVKRHRLNLKRLMERREFVTVVGICEREDHVDRFHPLWEQVEVIGNRINVKGPTR